MSLAIDFGFNEVPAFQNTAEWALGRVKNVSKRVFKNLLAFFAAILCILLGYLAKKALQRIFDGGKLTSKRCPPIKK